MSAEAFEHYRLDGMFLTSLEVDALRENKPIDSDNKREQREWDEKRRRLGLTDRSSVTVQFVDVGDGEESDQGTGLVYLAWTSTTGVGRYHRRSPPARAASQAA